MVEQRGEHLIYQWDIIVEEYDKSKITPRGAALLLNSYLWTDATIPYIIENQDPEIPLEIVQQQTDTVLEVIAILNTYTNLYIRLEADEAYVIFALNYLGNDYASQVGR